MAVKTSRKYDVLVKFLKDTITNPKITHRVRFAAAERLDNLYARQETLALQALRRHEREAKTEAIQGQEEPGKAAETLESIPATDATTEDQQVQAVFARLLRPKEGTDAAAE
jgi:hypothetical protein